MEIVAFAQLPHLYGTVSYIPSLVENHRIIQTAIEDIPISQDMQINIIILFSSDLM